MADNSPTHFKDAADIELYILANCWWSGDKETNDQASNANIPCELPRFI